MASLLVAVDADKRQRMQSKRFAARRFSQHRLVDTPQQRSIAAACVHDVAWLPFQPQCIQRAQHQFTSFTEVLFVLETTRPNVQCAIYMKLFTLVIAPEDGTAVSEKQVLDLRQHWPIGNHCAGNQQPVEEEPASVRQN